MPTDNAALELRLAKLPTWARDHIRELQGERDVAVKTLNDHIDHQTPSPFSYQEVICTGEESGPSFKRLFVQTHKIELAWGGIRLSVQVKPFDKMDRRIRIQWDDLSPEGRANPAGIVPESQCSVNIGRYHADR